MLHEWMLDLSKPWHQGDSSARSPAILGCELESIFPHPWHQGELFSRIPAIAGCDCIVLCDIATYFYFTTASASRIPWTVADLQQQIL